MKRELDAIEKYYGSKKNAAKAVGITYRHWLNVRNGKYIGRFLAMRIKQMAFEIKNRGVIR